ncbi:hypothetical protein NDU88_000692 [Pleurodeles waltl]|uniref:Carboxylic ester hydrolase n=1 Tax=Pleurodeles waltl TaxID=8319 RepID=A0AAV7Q4R5_PLEWA|nr:hypothetical protein NDU88_000692 [Pleurodeles waltl]
MLWIYGGAFLLGGSQGANFLGNYLYDGEELAVRGNVIVVTFNYRVGPLGFLSTGDANAAGNYGLWDQHMAISWVKRNIVAFGGDPDNITIFGESAGGVSVDLQLAEKVECPVGDNEAMVNCLKSTDPKALTLAYKVAPSGLHYPIVHYIAYGPIIDGDFIPAEPETLFKNAANVDYLAGVNNMNGHLFAGVDVPQINQPLQEINQ